MTTPPKEIPKNKKEATAYAGPRSLLRTLRIVEAIAVQPESMTLARLTQELKTPKSSLLGLLRALTQHAYLVHESNHYALGPAAHRLAMAIMPSFTLPQLARPIMHDLAQQTGETAVLAVLDPELQRVVYVDKFESFSTIRYTIPIGTTRPLYCTAAGRVLLAHQSEEWIEEYFNHYELEKKTNNTVTNREDLKQILNTVADSGYATTFAESSDDVAGFAAAVFDMDGRVAFALTLGAPIERGHKNAQRYVAATRTAAEKLSVNLGYVTGRRSPAGNQAQAVRGGVARPAKDRS